MGVGGRGDKHLWGSQLLNNLERLTALRAEEEHCQVSSFTAEERQKGRKEKTVHREVIKIA